MFKKLAVRGAAWTLIDTAGGQALSFVAFMILARLLVPEDYGVVTLAAVIVAIPSILVNEGFAEALVQRSDLGDEHVNSAFWGNLVIAVIFVILAQIGAGWIAELMGMPAVAPILRWLSLTLIGTALASIAGGLYRRQMEYSTFALRTFLSVTTGAVVGVVMAMTGFGIWSLVGQQLSAAVVNVVVLWRGIPWRPTRRFSFAALSDIYHFTSRLMLANAMRFATEKVDALIIGVMLDARALGFYYLVTRLLTTVNYVTISPIDQVMMPVLARMQDDRARLGSAFLNMIWALSSLWVPAVAALGILAPRLLPLLFGHKWDPAVPLMMIVSLTCLTNALTRPTPHVLIAVGRPDAMARLNLLQLVFTVIGFVAGVYLGGIYGAAWALAGVMFAIVPFHLLMVRHIVGILPSDTLSKYVPIVGATAIMAATMFLVELSRLPDIAMLAAQIAIGGAVYGVAIFMLAAPDVKQLLASIMPGRFRSENA